MGRLNRVAATGLMALAVSCGPSKSPDAGHGSASSHGTGSHGDKSQRSSELQFLFPDGDDRGWAQIARANAHHKVGFEPITALPAPVRKALAHQLRLMQEAALKYPTVADAEAAGFTRGALFRPGEGVHFGKQSLLIQGDTLTDENIRNPAVLIFDGTSPDSQIAGLMYLFARPADPNNPRQPEGFAGNGDRWHYHSNACTMRTKQGAVEILEVDKEGCARQGGTYTATGAYGIHVWPVAAYANPLGVFAHANPAISCPDGSYRKGKRRGDSICAATAE